MKQEIRDLYRMALLLDQPLFSISDVIHYYENNRSYVDEFAIRIKDKAIRIKPIKEFLRTFLK